MGNNDVKYIYDNRDGTLDENCAFFSLDQATIVKMIIIKSSKNSLFFTLPSVQSQSVDPLLRSSSQWLGLFDFRLQNTIESARTFHL